MLSRREFPADVSGTLATTPLPVRVMVAGKHQFRISGYFLYLFRQDNSLPGERYNMRRAHFGISIRETDSPNAFAGGGDSPDFVSEINLTPAGKTQFTGADKQMQGQRYYQPC